MSKDQQHIRDEFFVTGYFYVATDRNGKRHSCRSHLNLKRKNAKSLTQPDLMVIMMNPGSSRPENGDCDGRKETKTIPDQTQFQIMRVMNRAGYDYARVLNLSDIREPDSAAFCKNIEKGKYDAIAHSIFCPSRREELRALFERSAPVILAWGVSKALDKLVGEAINFIGDAQAIGWKNKDGRYYHPLPPVKARQAQWVTQITKRLKAS